MPGASQPAPFPQMQLYSELYADYRSLIPSNSFGVREAAPLFRSAVFEYPGEGASHSQFEI